MSGKPTFRYGELNPIKKPNKTRSMTHQSLARQDLVEVMRESAMARDYEVDALAGTGPYYGIVVAVVSAPGAPNLPPGGPWSSYLAKTATQPSANLYTIKVRIPELHADLPDPMILPGGPGTTIFNNFANMYPDFVGESGVPPEVGKLVQVDFQNRQDMEGGIWLSNGGGGGESLTGLGQTQDEAGRYAAYANDGVTQDTLDAEIAKGQGLPYHDPQAGRSRNLRRAARKVRNTTDEINYGTQDEMTLNGQTIYVDLHKTQEDIDYAAMAANGVVGAWVKSSQAFGKSKIFAEHVNGCAEVGVLVGAYHYAEPAGDVGNIVEGAQKEARFMAKVINEMGDKAKSLRPVLDYEERWTKDRDINTLWAISFGKEIEKILGVTPMVYTGASFWLSRFHTQEMLDFFGKPWIAQFPGGKLVPHRRIKEICAEQGFQPRTRGQTISAAAWQWTSGYRPLFNGGAELDVNTVPDPNITRWV